MTIPWKAVITLSLLGIVVALTDWNAVWRIVRDIDQKWLVAAIMIALLDRLLTNLRWQWLLIGQGLNTSFASLFKIQLSANFLGSFFPSFIGVDAVRTLTLIRQGNLSSKVISATLTDRITLALATLVVGIATAITFSRQLLPPDVLHSVFLAAFALLVPVGLFLSSRMRTMGLVVLKKLVPSKMTGMVLEVAQALKTYGGKPRLAWNLILVTALLFIIRIVFVVFIAKACRVDISFLEVFMVVPILWVIVMIPITIGNIGLQDVGYVMLMGLVGVPAAAALTMSLVEHLVVRLVILPGIFYVDTLKG